MNAMLDLTQVKFVLLSEARLPENATSSLDFVILYDVLVHVDLHVTNKYVREIFRVLKPGGKAFLSTANFVSPGERVSCSRGLGTESCRSTL